MTVAEALTWLIDQGHAERDGSLFDYRLTDSGEDVFRELAERVSGRPEDAS